MSRQFLHMRVSNLVKYGSQLWIYIEIIIAAYICTTIKDYCQVCKLCVLTIMYRYIYVASPDEQDSYGAVCLAL